MSAVTEPNLALECDARSPPRYATAIFPRARRSTSCLARMAAGESEAQRGHRRSVADRHASRRIAPIARSPRGDALGPLHGVPVTIKENVDQEGCATTNGVVGFQHIIAKSDSPIVANWKRAGAVIIGRTNTPAFSFRLDTVNDLRGRTYSPWSQDAHARRFVGRGVGVGRGRHHAARARQRHRRFGALSGVRVRPRRHPAFVRPRPGVQSDADGRALAVVATDVGARTARAHASRDVRLGLAAMATRDPRDPWWVPAPLDGPPLPEARRGGDCAGRSWRRQAASARRRGDRAGGALAGAMRATKSSTSKRRVSRAPRNCGSRCRCPSSAIIVLPVIEKEGDAGIRTAVRFKLENVPPIRPRSRT